MGSIRAPGSLDCTTREGAATERTTPVTLLSHPWSSGSMVAVAHRDANDDVGPAGRRELVNGGNAQPAAGAYSGAMPIVAWCSVVRCSMPSECAVGRVVAVPCWSHIRHCQIAVSTEAIASMLITSVTGRQMVMVPSPFPEPRMTSARRVARKAAVRN